MHERARRALAALGLEGAQTRPAGGATGTTWRVHHPSGEYALRLVAMETSEPHAMRAAARAGLPVPRVVATLPFDGTVALLLEWCAGATAGELLRRGPGSAQTYGVEFGEVHRRLHAVVAPGIIPAATDWHGVDAAGVPAGEALLHLDYHPLNVLMDGTRITALLDWTNARRGHPSLDLARTYALFHVDPALAEFSGAQRETLAAFTAGWIRGYGGAAAEIPPECLHWAGRTMLADLAHRYPSPRLDALRAWTAHHRPMR